MPGTDPGIYRRDFSRRTPLNFLGGLFDSCHCRLQVRADNAKPHRDQRIGTRGTSDGAKEFGSLEELMPHYFFDIKNGHRLIDPSGLDCSGDDEAIANAKMIALQIAQDTSGAGGQRHIAILDGERKEIGKIPVHPELKSAAE
jgi:hypothetical protein